MLPRSISKHVKDQNWFAVVLDFFIVVVGVFVGIQVSNWNAANQRTRTAEFFEARLISDIRNEIGVIENRIEHYTAVLNAANGLTAMVVGPKESFGPEFLRDAHFATSLWRFRRTQDTYDELITSGELGLIADSNVRSKLSRYYRDLDAVVGIWDKPSNFRNFVRMNMPAGIQERIRQNCHEFNEGKYEKTHFAFRSDCQLQITNFELRVAVDALLDPNVTGSQKFNVLLNELIAKVNFKARQLKRKRNSAHDLLTLMEAK